MHDVYYESLILEQQINYFILESNYGSICEAEQKKSILEKIKDFFSVRIEKVLSILKAIKEFIVKLFTKIIPANYKYIKMHLKDKLKNKNKEYTTIDIYQIKKNIDILNNFNIYGPVKDRILPSYIDLENVVCSEYYDKFIENIKRKNIGKYQEYISDEKEYQELSNIKQIKISYSEIFNMYSGMKKISNFKNKMFDRVSEELINFKDSFKKEAENIKKSFLNKDFNESLFQKKNLNTQSKFAQKHIKINKSW